MAAQPSMSDLDSEELDRRAAIIANEWDGVFAPFEAFYIHSIIYSSSRALGAFERFDVSVALKDSDANKVSAIHEALGHAAALSRFFWPSGTGAKTTKALKTLREARAAKLRAAFQMDETSPLRNRRLRDALEHFDEKLDRYLLEHDAGSFFPAAMVGDSVLAEDPSGHIFKLVDLRKQVFVILAQPYSFAAVRAEVVRVHELVIAMDKNGSRLASTDVPDSSSAI
jgi:hypothetical protein